MPELEKVNILTVYTKDGCIGVDLHEDVFNDYEIYGFLKVYLRCMEEKFIVGMKRDFENED